MAGTLTETLNTLYTTTWAKRRADVVDQVFEKNVLTQLLKSKGMIRFENTDGRRFEIPLRVGRQRTSKFFSKGATFTISDFDPLTVAFDDWKNFGDQIVRYWVDDKANGGNETRHLNMMNAKIDTVIDGLQTDFEDALWADVGGTSVKDYNGIQYLIDNAPSTSVSIHGLNQATQTDGAGNFIWRNQQKASSGVFSVFGESEMTNLYNTINRWGKVDAIISDQATHELGEAEAIERVRVVNKEAVDLGLDHITFKGKMWVWSPKCPAGFTYMLDRRYLGMTIDPAANFTMGNWKELPTAFKDFVVQIVQRGNMWRSKPQALGVLTGQT